MFGPSECMFGETTNHHRSNDFREFLSGLEHKFKRKFAIQDDWVVLFLAGGGTLANESILASFDCVVDGPNTPFVERLHRLNKYNHRNSPPKVRCCLAYDTALSMPIDVLPSDDLLTFVDCVSSFPYYQPSGGVDAWSTVSGKQLGSTPGIGILAMSPKFLDLARVDSSHSVLSVADQLEYRVNGETPHTPAISLLEDLDRVLDLFSLADHTAMIHNRRELLEAVVPDEFIVGHGPVFTVRAGKLPDWLIHKWDLYPGMVGPQLFLHAEGDWADIMRELGEIKWHC